MIVERRSGHPLRSAVADVKTGRRSVESTSENPSENTVEDASCPAAARLRATLTDTTVLRAAMRRHVERCRSCREAMLVQEPTTLFRRLPQVELSADEIAEMRQRVKGVRRARRVGGSSDASTRRSAWAAAAATVCVLGGLAAFQVGMQDRPTAASESSLASGAPLSALSAEDEARLDRALASRALIEGDDVLSEQVVLMQVAGRASDLAWVANDRLDL